MTYNALIHREQGGSILNVGAGGSLAVAAGGLVTFQSGASLRINQSGPSGTVLAFNVGTSVVSISLGTDAPTHVAGVGSIYIRTNGSMAGLYTNITQDAAGSTWRGFQQGSAVG